MKGRHRGYNADLRHYTGEDLIVVFASNHRIRGHGDRELIMNTVARLMRGERIPPPPALTQISQASLNAFAGTYVNARGASSEPQFAEPR